MLPDNPVTCTDWFISFGRKVVEKKNHCKTTIASSFRSKSKRAMEDMTPSPPLRENVPDSYIYFKHNLLPIVNNKDNCENIKNLLFV